MGKAPGVFCLEGDWEESIESRLSIEPALRLLEARDSIRLVHRDVATRAELEYYFDKWLTGRLRSYTFGYLGFHGTDQTLWIGNENVTLDELGEMLRGRCKGRVIYFGACGVLAAEGDVLQKFCRQTGARAVAGYTRDIDWVEGAAFELLLVQKLSWATNMKPAFDWLNREYPDLTRKLGFRMAHSSWSSDRTVAVRAAKHLENE
ncbi:DUF6642 family protein [Gordonia rubripertincta]|uniref:CHAT domain-containing protein n=1 Tax=Gordonia rubripertincta TaxID=36822 RepID=A0ABT4MYY9_GORRU|nr:DUF6642 family protein [Gordonia rubripertincta]MCZ4552223.1 hypothetical protein [Gordonia rubripertincta]